MAEFDDTNAFTIVIDPAVGGADEMWVNDAGTFKRSTPHVKVGAAWVAVDAYVKVGPDWVPVYET